MDKLKELLGEELFAEVAKKLPSDKKYLFAEEGTFIPKHRFDEVNVQNKDLKGQIATFEGQLKELNGKATGNEELQKQIATLTEQNKKTVSEYESKISARELAFAIDTQLTGLKPKNIKAVKALLNLNDVKLTEQGVVGLNEQVEALQKSDPYLFEATTQPAPAKVGVEVKAPSGTAVSSEMESIAKAMGLKDVTKIKA